MMPLPRRIGPLVLAVLLFAAPGCMEKPSSLVRTQAKPPGLGNLADFGPNAVKIEIRPLQSTNPVRTQHLVVATVLDDKGQPRRKRRVEWILDGVGSIVEVDERGFLTGRGHKVDNRYAISYTDYFEHTINRGNGQTKDDFTIGPGQTWCIISSPVEGDSHLTVYAPEVQEWDKREVVTTVHWSDCQWQFPAAATVRAGGQYALTTNLFRHSDRSPLPNYRVRYTLLDGGPPAALLPNRTREVVVNSDQNGAATAALAHLALQPGVNHVGIEVIRPSDPADPNSQAVILAKHETTVDWQGAQINVRLSTPETAVVDQEVPTTITVTNSGQVETRDGNVYLEIPPGMSFVRSDPPAREKDGSLVWDLQSLGGGRQQAIQAVFRTKQTGTFSTVARAVTRDEMRAENTANLTVDVAQLKLKIDAPTATIVAGEPFTLSIAVSNPGMGAATNVALEVLMEDGLEAILPAGNVQRQVKNQLPKLEGNETRAFGLRMVARRGGPLNVEVAVKADGGLQANQKTTVNGQQPQLELRRAGPANLYLNKDGTWSLRVRNSGQVPLPNLSLRERLPAEVAFRNASDNGQLNAQINEIVWNLGTLAPGEERIVRYNAFGARPTTRGILSAIATAYPNVEQKFDNTIQVLGVPALRVEATSDFNPVEVGRTVNYTIRVVNQGTLAADNVEVSATFPPALLRILAARGPQNGRVDKDKITFPPLNGLPPNQVATFSVNAQALQAGDARFRVSTTALSIGTPVVQEEATRIIAPINGGPVRGPGR